MALPACFYSGRKSDLKLWEVSVPSACRVSTSCAINFRTVRDHSYLRISATGLYWQPDSLSTRDTGCQQSLRAQFRCVLFVGYHTILGIDSSFQTNSLERARFQTRKKKSSAVTTEI